MGLIAWGCSCSNLGIIAAKNVGFAKHLPCYKRMFVRCAPLFVGTRTTAREKGLCIDTLLLLHNKKPDSLLGAVGFYWY